MVIVKIMRNRQKKKMTSQLEPTRFDPYQKVRTLTQTDFHKSNVVLYT